MKSKYKVYHSLVTIATVILFKFDCCQDFCDRSLNLYIEFTFIIELFTYNLCR